MLNDVVSLLSLGRESALCLFSPKLQVSGPVKEVGVAGRILLDNIFYVVRLLGFAKLLSRRKVLELRMGTCQGRDVSWVRGWLVDFEEM